MAKLTELIAALSAPGAQPAAAQGNEQMALFMTMMQQQQANADKRADEERAARIRQDDARREEKAQMTQAILALAGLVLPKLLEKPAIDPFVLKLLDNSNNKDTMKEMLATSQALQQQNTANMIQQVTQMFTLSGDMQSRMNEKSMEMMEERLERLNGKDDADAEQSPFMAIIDKVLPKLLGDTAAPVAGAVISAAAKQAPRVAAATATVNAVPVEHPPEVANKVKILQLVMSLHMRGSKMDEEKRHAFHSQLVRRITMADDVAQAIMQDDQGGLFSALAGAVSVEPPIGKWVATLEAQTFIGKLIQTLIKPSLIGIAAEMRKRQEADQQRQEQPPQAIIPATAAPTAPATPPATEPPVLGPGSVAEAG